MYSVGGVGEGGREGGRAPDHSYKFVSLIKALVRFQCGFKLSINLANPNQYQA